MRSPAGPRPPASRAGRTRPPVPGGLRARLRAALEELRARPTGARAERALARQLVYQQRKAAALPVDAAGTEAAFVARARALRRRLERHVRIDARTHVLEVGSGAHGHVFFLGAGVPVGVDPLAAAYRALFPWQGRAATVAADGAALPFREDRFDVALSDNVVDHARDPAGIVGELVRVLRPGGVLYLAVHVHHPVWDAASRVHGVIQALGLPLEIGPFADHTVHLTEPAARALVARHGLEILEIGVVGGDGLGGSLRSPALRRLVAAVGRVFPKNRLLEVVARRPAGER